MHPAQQLKLQILHLSRASHGASLQCVGKTRNHKASAQWNLDMDKSERMMHLFTNQLQHYGQELLPSLAPAAMHRLYASYLLLQRADLAYLGQSVRQTIKCCWCRRLRTSCSSREHHQPQLTAQGNSLVMLET
jgi:hypothetical protein